jgi:hypothetical protein
MITEINSIDDVKTFALHLSKVEKLSYHPDDDFNDCIKISTQEPLYTKKEATLRNALMKQCFIICEKEGADIYEIILPIVVEVYD